ncbi:cilia- and flagella-associated protein 251-like [Branchiostoma floridae]|uniref:Cilia- and flagella-associated protein 251 n=1 Tax=Branchiostoma floridae TaxID=7739 RepID=A0A9J7LY04_BRAFL|nr:cilia- and flagella-associated protein 251-like [Branchiostoma floridae]
MADEESSVPAEEKIEATQTAGPEGAETEAPPADAEGQPEPEAPETGDRGPTEAAEGAEKTEEKTEEDKPEAEPTETEGTKEAPTVEAAQEEGATEEEKPQSPAGSKPASQAGSARGSKPPTPTGSKPGTPQGSKPGTPKGSKPPTPRGSKPPTPTGSQQGTPRAGSREGSAPGSRQGSAGKERTASAGKERPTSAGKERPSSGKDRPPSAGKDRPGSGTARPSSGRSRKSSAASQKSARAGSAGKPPSGKASPVVPGDQSVADTKPPTVGGRHTPVSRKSEASEEPIPIDALNMVWSFGLNKRVPAINMTDDQRRLVLYTCAHTAVLYDYSNNTQKLLQGHCNVISSTCVSEDRRWIATADSGQNSMVIVWDSYSCIPVQTLFDPHVGGVTTMAMTPDAKFLVTVSAAETQTVAIWDWTTESDGPICQAELDPAYGHQNYVLFNPEDPTELVSNSESQVIFYSWKGGKLEYYAPELDDSTFNRAVGQYSQSIFQFDLGTRAFTATSVGNIVVWDSKRPSSEAPANSNDATKKALKLVRLQDRAITVLTTTDSYIVTGDVMGHVKFYDDQLTMINWYSDFDLGPVNALSFMYMPEFITDVVESSGFPPDATIAASKFVVKDFIVGTATAVMGHVKADGTILDVILLEHDAAVHAICTHPTEPRLCMGSYSGLLKIWDYERKEVLVSRQFERGNMIRCLAFDPTGLILAAGFMDGSVRVLDALTLDDEVSEPFRYARDSVTHCCFSHDSNFLATADADFTVSVFRTGRGQEEEAWVYLGRHRAHYKLIESLMFGMELDTNQPRLLSLGRDRVMVEYDLVNSGKDDLRLLSQDRIEQSAVPSCMAWYPPVTKESFIVTANSQFKLKLYNTTTKMCRKTLLGPTYGAPVQKVAVLPTTGSPIEYRHLAYITTDKVGLHILPADGNPHKAMALIAHPTGVANLACSYDGKYVFTAGGEDCTAHMWSVSLKSLDAACSLGGENLIPFYGLLDGGREGEFFRELEDYFYYAQIRSQGVDATIDREVSTTIPLSEVPYVMRALGFYPTEQEIDDMLNEVKFSKYVETGQYVTHIDLGDFIRLYINHRPAFGLSPLDLQKAFEILGMDTEDGPAIDRGSLLDLLQSKGEHMTEAELAEFLTTLVGMNPEGGSSELGPYDSEQGTNMLEDALPRDFTAVSFAADVLGFQLYAPSTARPATASAASSTAEDL